MPDNFGKLLRQFREQNDFSQETLAKRLGVAQPTISTWERGKKPDEREQRTILKKLGLSDIIQTSVSLSFGSWLRRARADKGWTQKELAEKADLSITTINLIENDGITEPQKRTKESLIRALGEGPEAEDEKPQAVQEAQAVQGVSEYEEVDADSIERLPERPGIYILNAVNEKGRKRPIYVGTAKNLRERVSQYAHNKRGVWWFRKPLVGIVGYVEIHNEALRKRIEIILQKGLDPLLIFNDQNVDGGD